MPQDTDMPATPLLDQAKLRADLELSLAALDELGAFEAGAHLSMAISALERHFERRPPLRLRE